MTWDQNKLGVNEDYVFTAESVRRAEAKDQVLTLPYYIMHYSTTHLLVMIEEERQKKSVGDVQKDVIVPICEKTIMK